MRFATTLALLLAVLLVGCSDRSARKLPPIQADVAHDAGMDAYDVVDATSPSEDAADLAGLPSDATDDLRRPTDVAPADLSRDAAPPCPSGFAACSGEADGGCETDLRVDEKHCGACDIVCGEGTRCIAGTCRSRRHTRMSILTGVACAALDDGAVWCWGAGHAPARVPGLPPAVEVSAGGPACALTANGEVWCWDATPTDAPSSPTVAPFTTPAVTISSGIGVTCTVHESGGVECWGNNRKGALGNGTTAETDDPVWANVQDIYDVAAGLETVCASEESGTVWCWGDDEYWLLGNAGPKLPHSAVPVRHSFVDNALSLSANWQIMCAMRADDPIYRDVECWGTQFYSPPDHRALGWSWHSDAEVVDAGYNHVCVAGPNGAQCAGFNNEGQLGNDTPDGSTELDDVIGLEGHSIVDIAAGFEFSCALTEADEVYCWGANPDGQLGYFGTGSATPVQVELGD